MQTDTNIQLLRNSTYIELDSSSKRKFTQLASEVADWDDLVAKAESNALSNLLYTHLQTCEISIPDQNRITFRALTARHQRNNRERTHALEEILDAFAEHGINAILLKGMALIHVLYNEQCQRPMGDIDILVEQDKALLAQECLRGIGYDAGDRKQGYLYDHHHLPVATKKWNGLGIQVEIHHNALSGDARGSIAYDEVFGNCLEIDVNGRKAYTLGPMDMLNHLCHHTFEPIENIKLGAVADIYGFANRYNSRIDWSQLKTKEPFVANALRCLHFLSPLPESLDKHLNAPLGKPPEGVGKGFPTLSSTFNARISYGEKFRKIFRCSRWWQHINYVVPPERSLLLTRYIRHPATVAFWVLRRIIAKTKSRIADSRS